MNLLALAPIAFLFAIPTASAEIYRCSGRSAMTVYQNFPCEFDRLASVPGTRSFDAETTGRPSSASRQPRSMKAAERSGTGAIAASPSMPAVPRVGMTTAEVRAIWGEPRYLSKEELTRKDVEIWSYADSRSIEFDRKGRVTTIHW